MDLNKLTNIYLVGIGGIGMSALARYFRQKGLKVGGYDRVETALTRSLVSEGIEVDSDGKVDERADLVIYTPAIPLSHPVLKWYQENGYSLYKRSEVLQWITEGEKCIAVAGTHGKTTISTMIAYLLRKGEVGGYAFLGGVSVNYNTNFWREGERSLVVVEADEYDRSFLRLSPDMAVLTAMDADHLDVYGDENNLQNAFVDFTRNIRPGGCLWYKHGLPASKFSLEKKYAYSLQNDAAEAWADNIRINDGGYQFDWKNKEGLIIEGLKLNLGGMHNVENAVVAIAVALESGIEVANIKQAMEGFKGVKRRFEYVVKNEDVVYIDDYAHHPKELESLIQSAMRLFPSRKCTVAFQPHLYSRTKDLAQGFADSLDAADEVILLPVYPAREEPIEGVSSELIKEKMARKNATVLSMEGLLQFVKEAPIELLITAGAGDLDKLVTPIKEILLEKK